MTCIVAVTDGQTVVIGGDSAGAAGQELRIRADPKVFLVGSFAIGFTTSFRMGQILRYSAHLPEPPPESGPEAVPFRRAAVCSGAGALRKIGFNQEMTRPAETFLPVLGHAVTAGIRPRTSRIPPFQGGDLGRSHPGLAPRRLGSAVPAPGFTLRPLRGLGSERHVLCPRHAGWRVGVLISTP